jgi:hypothetical protein
MRYLPSSRISLPAPAATPSVVQTQVLSSLDFPYVSSSSCTLEETKLLKHILSEKRKGEKTKIPMRKQFECKDFTIPQSHFIGALPEAVVSRIIQYVGGPRPNYFELCWAWRHKQVNTSRAPGLQLESELPPDCGVSFKGGHSTVLPLRPKVPYLRYPFPLMDIENGQIPRVPQDVHFVDHAFITKVIGEHEILHSVWKFHAKKWMVAQRIVYFLSVCVHQVPTGAPTDREGEGNLITAFLEAFRRDGEEIHGCCRQCLTDFMIQSSENCTTVQAWQYLRSRARKPHGTLIRTKPSNKGRTMDDGSEYTDRLVAGTVRDMEQLGEVRLFYNQAEEGLTHKDVIILCQAGVYLVRDRSDGSRQRKWVAPKCKCSDNVSEPCQGVAWKTWHTEARKRLPIPKKKDMQFPDEAGQDSEDELDDARVNDGDNGAKDAIEANGQKSSNVKRQRGVDEFGEGEPDGPGTQSNCAKRQRVRGPSCKGEDHGNQLDQWSLQSKGQQLDSFYAETSVLQPMANYGMFANFMTGGPSTLP